MSIFKFRSNRGRQLDRIEMALKFINQELKRMSQAFDRLTVDIAAQNSVIASNNTLLASLVQQIRDTAGNEAAANALADQLEANTKTLNDAVIANTPAAPTEPTPAA